MRSWIEDRLVKVEATGTELLRAKTTLNAAFGPSKIRSRAGGFEFPVDLIANAYEAISRLKPDQHLKDRIDVFARHADARRAALQMVETRSADPLENGWNEKLDAHQAVAVSAMTVPGLIGLCLFDEQGLGKTPMAIAAYDVLRQKGQVDRAIVLCPKTMIEVWRGDFGRFVGGKYKIVSLNDPADPVYPPGFEAFDVYLVNFEGLGKVGGRLAATSARARTLLVVDESFFLKNPNARRTTMALNLRASCSMGFVLCGTPAPNSFVDVLSQYDLADNGFTFGSVRPDNITDVQNRADTRGTRIRRLKSEVMPQLADKVFIPQYVELSPRQKALYEKTRNDAELRLRTMDNRTVIRPTDTYFQERATMLQICSSPSSVDHTYLDPPPKVLALDALLETLIEGQGKKVVLWSYYTDTLNLFLGRYARFNPVAITGDTPTEFRPRAVEAFQGDPAVKLFIGNAGAAGAGITLTASSDAVYYSLSNQAAHFLQSLDRIHRRGQTAPQVNVHVLLAADTLEEREYALLLAKAEAQGALLRDEERRPFTVADAIDELGGTGAG